MPVVRPESQEVEQGLAEGPPLELLRPIVQLETEHVDVAVTIEVADVERGRGKGSDRPHVAEVAEPRVVR